MGYELYITRARSWLETEAAPIPEAEWNAVIISDPELEISLEDYYDRTKDGVIQRVQPAIWKIHPDRVPFWYGDGAINTKSPDKATICKMAQISQKLRARVLDEADEEYGTDGEPVNL